MLKIAVLMPGEVGQLGEFLADARALDTAGAHALWLDEGAQDPWMLAAALVTVTSRARLGVRVPPGADLATLVPRLRTLDRCRGDVSSFGARPRAPRRCARWLRAVDRCRFVRRGGRRRPGRRSRGLADGLVLSGHEPDEDRVRLGRARDLVGGAARRPRSNAGSGSSCPRATRTGVEPWSPTRRPARMACSSRSTRAWSTCCAARTRTTTGRT